MVTGMSLVLVQAHRETLSAGPISCWQCGYIRLMMPQTSPPLCVHVVVGWAVPYPQLTGLALIGSLQGWPNMGLDLIQAEPKFISAVS